MDRETVALVRRLRDELIGATADRTCIADANSWLAAHEKPVERWEPCSEEHIETKDGRWLREQAHYRGLLERRCWMECKGEHRVRHGNCCDSVLYIGIGPRCGGMGFEKNVLS